MADALHLQGPVVQLLEEARLTHHFSAYQLYSKCGTQTASLASGYETGWTNGAAIDAQTVFDLGSLTKVIATTSIVARLCEAKKISLTDPLDCFLPSLSPRWGRVTLAQLLSHCSGAEGWCAYFESRKQGETFLDWFRRNQGSLAVAGVEEKIIYSDVGFSLLGEALRAVTQQPLEVLFAQEVVKPLGLSGIGYGPVEARVVATEFCQWRNRLLHGEVFDFNTSAMGGVSAQAGLFASATGLAAFCQAWLDAVQGKSRWLSAVTAKKFTEKAIELQGVAYALGWDLPAAKGSSAGDKLSRKSFGHLGYTGTSIWIDPERKGIVIFLSNRVHPSQLDERIRAIRPALHNLVVSEWEKNNE